MRDVPWEMEERSPPLNCAVRLLKFSVEIVFNVCRLASISKWFFWTCGETEGVANSFLGKMHPEALLDKDLITHQVCL
jgi:hypothetical protein